MLDYRIHTFLKLCDLMNYRLTSEELNMTQPAVTQHIQFLEREYDCKFFTYNGKKLKKTPQCELLETYLRSSYYNEMKIKEKLKESPIKKISIGTTKTIGDYLLPEKISQILKNDDIELNLFIENTSCLLESLNKMNIDIAVIEGYFDKNKYGFNKFKDEKLVGICSIDHKFAGKEVSLEEIFQEKILLREKGSGTREVFEHFLTENNLSLSCFQKSSNISSFKVIEESVQNKAGISFVYEAIADSNKKLSKFTIKNAPISHEFNFVFLKDTDAENIIPLLI